MWIKIILTIITILAGNSLAILARQANWDCKATQSGTAPSTFLPDTPEAFQQNKAYAGMSLGASTKPPFGYHNTFSAENGAVEGSGFMDIFTVDSYSPQYCADKCDSIEGCEAFNIYIERDPGRIPSEDCRNPPSIANYRCTFWSDPKTVADTTNAGQYQSDFHVVIAGSSGFIKDQTSGLHQRR